MDKALLNDKIVSAYEISLDYQTEKAVRADSKRKNIKCIDPNCQNPILRYCHGDKKEAYFAHLINSECDYSEFDKNDNELFKELRIKLFQHFTTLGYKVQTEVKLLEHHYSPLLCSKDNETFVIEMGDQKTTLGFIERILKEYTTRQLLVKWIVVGEEIPFHNESDLSCLKRFLINESTNNEFILVDGEKLIQYRWDKKTYQLNYNSPIYQEKANLKDLCVVNGELSIHGFNEKFIAWQNQKESSISQELAKRKEAQRQYELRHQAELEKQELQRKQAEQARYSHIEERKIWSPYSIPKQPSYSSSKVVMETKSFTCTQCGKTAEEGDFYMTQGNTGTCWECHYGPERWQEIKKHRGL